MSPRYKRKSRNPSSGLQNFQASLRSRGTLSSFFARLKDLEEGFECLGREWNSIASPQKPKAPNLLKRKFSIEISGQAKRTTWSQNQKISKRLNITEPSSSSEDEVDDRNWDDDWDGDSDGDSDDDLDNDSNEDSDADSDEDSDADSEGDSDENDIDPVENWDPRMKNCTWSLRRSRAANPNNTVLKHRSATKLTPWLYKLAKPFYNDKIQEISCNFLDYSKNATPVTAQEVSRLLRHVQNKAKKDASQTSRFCSPPIWTTKNGKRGYPSAEVHGITYYPGNFILLSGKVQAYDTKRTSKYTCIKGNEILVARVEYFFDEGYDWEDRMVHIRWFEFGTTLFGELASHNELFALTLCQDIPVEHIYGKINVEFLKGQKVHCVAELGVPKDWFFYRFHYDTTTNQYTEASIHECLEPEDKRGSRHCYCCTKETHLDADENVKLHGKLPNQGHQQYHKGDCYKQASLGKVEYNLHDFVYIFKSLDAPYTIGQITEISTKDPHRNIAKGSTIKPKHLKITVGIFERYDRFRSSWWDELSQSKRHGIRDERRLYCTGRSEQIDVDDLDGKCHVKHRDHIHDLDAFKDQKDTFWFNEQVKSETHSALIRRSDLRPVNPERVSYPAETEAEMARKKEKLDDFLKNGPKLRGMDIFAGIGGLSLGLKAGLRDAVEFVSAVEFSEAACRTYSKNHPNCVVHNADASLLLERAIRREKGEILEPLYDCHGKVVPELERPGKIDFICGGPPCPGFSSANRFQKPDDIKNSLMALYLAYIDFYKPKYFLIENVTGLLRNKLLSIDKQERTTIDQGTLKFIIRTATSLGYQIQHALLQAAEHGVPQSRHRVFFWGAQLGYRLPSYPQPENVVNLHTRRTKYWPRERQAAPHSVVTVGDAITDLPAFEWIDPSASASECRKREERRQSIKQYEVKKHNFTGRDTQTYASPPLSEYQRKLRASVTQEKLTAHVTESRNATQIHRVCLVPLLPGADHRSIPNDEKPAFLSNTRAEKHKFYPGRIGRLDMAGVFKVCLTDLNPTSKPGTVLHPTQHRVITIREFARAMSFPDDFSFDLENSNIKDIIRQIGNAVPPNFAKALGGELLEVLVERYHSEKCVNSTIQGATRAENVQDKKSPAKVSSITKETERTSLRRSGGMMGFRAKGSRDNPITFDDSDEEDGFIDIDSLLTKRT